MKRILQIFVAHYFVDFNQFIRTIKLLNLALFSVLITLNIELKCFYLHVREFSCPYAILKK